MFEAQKKLVDRLLELNAHISVGQAQVWVELLWEDFESTYAKAGREYQGEQVTEKVVSQWIENYGGRLHEFVAENPKYKDFLADNKKKLH
ncbi:MAG TPA: YfhJ family protein [Niallia sp.]|nr:YfhJ family protein [Niallia sp.]